MSDRGSDPAGARTVAPRSQTQPSFEPQPPQPPQPFGSYPAADVTWLLKDLGDAALERPLDEREEAIQGGRHYSEMLPVEYRPSEAYQALFIEALHSSAQRVAAAVAAVGDQIVERRGPEVVLASLARAGTPIGVLIRRWLRFRHGIDTPHYTLSIIRGRGIDLVAVRWLLARHRAETIQFVDGWTGKGAILRELVAACDGLHVAGLRPDLAVLADPGHCTDLFGTRDDFLIPSACLNATVSGLVSRTVLNDRFVGPGDFHGAKWYRELAGEDVSNLFVDTVTAAFDSVGETAGKPPWSTESAAESARRERCAPTWAGLAAVRTIQDRFGIADSNLVKPGVGETTRVLLRRVPWKVLINPDRARDLGPVLLLARERGVEIVEDLTMVYSACGIIRPLAADPAGAAIAPGTPVARSSGERQDPT